MSQISQAVKNNRSVVGRGSGQRRGNKSGTRTTVDERHKGERHADSSRQKTRRDLPTIQTTNFNSIFHSQLCRAAKYKVHLPNCSCSKLESLRKRYDDDCRSLADQLKDLAISDPLDHLVVVPDTKTTPAIFVCNDATSEEFRADASQCERKLANEIFEGKNGSLNALPFKVACAACLLTGHQKNGFLAIVSDSAQELQPTIEEARVASNKASHLHSDHGNVCAVELSSLKSLLSAKTRARSNEVVSEMIEQLKNGGIDLQSADASSIKLGHHLTSLLSLLQGKLKMMSGYIMVIVYDDGPKGLELDLPGGKRHLGETTLQSLVREVREETMIQLDEEWLSERLSSRYGGLLQNNCEDIHALESKKHSANMNVYFVVKPWIKLIGVKCTV